MKTTARLVTTIIVLLAPALALAQTAGMPGYTQQPSYTQQSTLFFSGGTVFSPMMGIGSCVGGGIYCAAQTILYVINGVLVPVLFAIAFIVFLYGIAKAYIFSHGEPEEVSKGHKLVLWGIIAFAVMISVWGLVNVVANTFGLNGQYAPPQPYSPYNTTQIPIR